MYNSAYLFLAHQQGSGFLAGAWQAWLGLLMCLQVPSAPHVSHPFWDWWASLGMFLAWLEQKAREATPIVQEFFFCAFFFFFESACLMLTHITLLQSKAISGYKWLL